MFFLKETVCRSYGPNLTFLGSSSNIKPFIDRLYDEAFFSGIHIQCVLQPEHVLSSLVIGHGAECRPGVGQV
jgi:hypothetical protein